MDIQILIKSYEELEDIDSKIEIINDIINTIKIEKAVLIANLSEYFIFLSKIILDSNEVISLKAYELLEISFQLLENELELRFKLIIDALILNLGNLNKSIRKKTKEILFNFLKKTRNVIYLLSEINKKGIRNKNTLIKSKSMKISYELIKIEQTICFSQRGIILISDLLENIISNLYNENSEIKKKAEKTIILIKLLNLQGIDQSIERICIEYQKELEKIKDNTNNFIDFKFKNIDFSQIINMEEEFIGIDLEQLKKDYFFDINSNIMENFPKKMNKNLYFGFLPENLLMISLENYDLKTQIETIDKINELFLNEKNLNEIFILSFIKYLIILLKKYTLFPILTNIYSMINYILNIPGINCKLYLPILISVLIEKLNDDRVPIRNIIINLLKKIMKYVSIQVFLHITSIFLEINNNDLNDWHLKEELLNLIKYLFENMIEKEKIKKISFFALENFREYLNKISILLDHKTKKVRISSLNCLKSICENLEKSSILEILHEILNKDIYDNLTDLLNNETEIYIIPSKINETEKINNEIISIEKPLEEKINNKSYIIESEKEKILKRNEELEKISFYNDYSNIISDSKEVIVNINDFKITNPKKNQIQTNQINVKITETQNFIQPKNDQSENIVHLNENFIKKINQNSDFKDNYNNYQTYTYNENEADEDDDQILIDTKKYNKKTEENKQEIIDVDITKKFIETPPIIVSNNFNFKKREIYNKFLSYKEDELKSKRNSPLKKPIKSNKNEFAIPKFSEISEFSDPFLSMHKMLLQLKSSDISEKNNALYIIRSLCKYNIELLYNMSISIPHIIDDLYEFIKIPSLNKHSIITLLELIEKLRKVLEINVEKLIEIIIFQIDSYNLILDNDSYLLLEKIVTFFDVGILVETIIELRSKENRNLGYKKAIAQFIEKIIEKEKSNTNKLKDFSKFITILTQIIYDPNYDVRQIGKKSLFKLLNYQLLNRKEFEELLYKNLPLKEFEKLQDFLTKHKELIPNDYINEYYEEK